jgi:ATP-binding cassette subfamily B (MDR/TAP) protein 1
VQGLASLGVAFYYSWNLTLVVMCTIPILYLVQSSVASRLALRSYEQAEMLQSALKYITTTVTSIETVKCFNGERYELHVFTNIITIAASLYRRVANFRSMQIGIMQFFTVSVFVQGFWYGSHLVATGESDPEQVLTTFWAALMAMSGITQIMPQLIVLQQGKMAGAKLSVLMKRISTSDRQFESQGQLQPDRCLGSIEFRKVILLVSLLCSALTNSSGHIFISVTRRRVCHSRCFPIDPSWRDDFCHRQKWFREEYLRTTSRTLLSTFFGTNTP